MIEPLDSTTKRGVGKVAGLGLFGRTEPIAYPPHGTQVDGRTRISFDRLAEPTNVDIQRTRVAQVVSLPDLLHQEGPGQHLSWMTHQRLKELALLRSERFPRPTVADQALLRVKDYISHLKDGH